jgi:mono/diheme cytochrome c family protein
MRALVSGIALIVAACQQNARQEAKPSPTPADFTYEGADHSSEADKVAHGERLSHVLACVGCHGSDLRGKNMADKPEDGAMFSPNLTLLVARYSDADFDRLFREGVPKDGREFWFMQVESYQSLSDADLAALVAYLRTLKPSGKVRPAFKFNRAEQKDVDQGVLGDAKAQIAKYRKNPPVDLGPRHAWGRYLVRTTCTACHNNALQGWPNFTPNLDIAGAYSKPELTQLLTNGKGKGGKDVGEMSGIARAYFAHLTARERGAIVDYIIARANRPESAGRS